MILPDFRIHSSIVDIEPFDPDQVQPASYDLRLGDELKEVVARGPLGFSPSDWAIDPYNPESHRLATDVIPVFDGGWHLSPGKIYLGTTLERISLPDDVCAQVMGKSSLGRLGLQVHSTAGFVDPGFMGEITLELSVIGNPILLRPGMLIAQIMFMQMDYPAERPYGTPGLGSKYQGQAGPTASKYSENGA